MKKNVIAIVLLAAVVAGSGGFFIGKKYQENKRQIFSRQFGNLQNGRQGNQGFGNGNRMTFRPVSGEIISQDEKSVTVKAQDGSSKIVLLSENTKINRAAEASKEDLKTGEKVAVFGTANADGSITAENIQINPSLNALPLGQPNN